jgi:hypothetical protein
MPKLAYANAAGMKVSGVTTVIGSSLGWKSPGLMYWAWKVGSEGKDLREERNKAADAGTLAHACAEALITGQPLPEIPEEHKAKVEGAVAAFKAWREQSRLDLVASEVPLVSEAHGYGGCIDAVGVFNGEAAIIDFKSSKDLYPDVVVQVAAYAHLWTENHPDVPIKAWHVLRWGPEGDFHHHSLSALSIAAGWRVFLACLEIYNLRKTVKP